MYDEEVTCILKKWCKVLLVTCSGICVVYATAKKTHTCNTCGKSNCICHQSAQDSCIWSLRGTIVDAERRVALPFASLWIQELQKGVIADQEGVFRVDSLCASWYHIDLQYVGYEKAQIHVRIPSQDTIFAMYALYEHLSEVEIQAAQRQALLAQEIIDTEALDAAQDLGTLLEHIPGIQKLSTGHYISKPMIDGLYGQRIVILSNEITQEAQQWGTDHAPPIDVLGIHRVELLRGANKFRYSTGALGGVLFVEPLPLSYSRNIWQSKWLTRLSLNGRRAELFGQLSNAYALKEGWKMAHNSYVSIKRGGDLRTPGYYLANTAVQELNGAAEVGVQRNIWDVSLYYSYFSSNLGILQSSHIGNVADLKSAIALGSASASA